MTEKFEIEEMITDIDDIIDKINYERNTVPGPTEQIKTKLFLVESYLKKSKTCLENVLLSDDL